MGRSGLQEQDISLQRGPPEQPSCSSTWAASAVAPPCEALKPEEQSEGDAQRQDPRHRINKHKCVKVKATGSAQFKQIVPVLAGAISATVLPTAVAAATAITVAHGAQHGQASRVHKDQSAQLLRHAGHPERL